MIKFLLVSIVTSVYSFGYAESIVDFESSMDQLEVLGDSSEIFHVAPNPFSTQVTITCDKEFDEEVTVNLYDPLGNLIRTYSSGYLESPSVLILPVEGTLKDGMYFIEVIDLGLIYRERVFYLGN